MKRIILVIAVFATLNVQAGLWEATKLAATHPVECGKFLWMVGPHKTFQEAKQCTSAKAVVERVRVGSPLPLPTPKVKGQ